MIVGYYKLESLPDDVKAQNKIRSKARLDCIAYAGNYTGLYPPDQLHISSFPFAD